MYLLSRPKKVRGHRHLQGLRMVAIVATELLGHVDVRHQVLINSAKIAGVGCWHALDKVVNLASVCNAADGDDNGLHGVSQK